MAEGHIEAQEMIPTPLVALDSSLPSNFEVDGEDAALSGWLIDLLCDLMGGPPHPDPEADDTRLI